MHELAIQISDGFGIWIYRIIIIVVILAVLYLIYLINRFLMVQDAKLTMSRELFLSLKEFKDDKVLYEQKVWVKSPSIKMALRNSCGRFYYKLQVHKDGLVFKSNYRISFAVPYSFISQFEEAPREEGSIKKGTAFQAVWINEYFGVVEFVTKEPQKLMNTLKKVYK